MSVVLDRSSSGLDGQNRTDSSWTLTVLFRRHRIRILLGYGLFVVENVAGLAGPLALGLAIRGLLERSGAGLLVLTVQQAVHLVAGLARRCYDTRVYTTVYRDLSVALVERQRQDDVPVSSIAARSALGRQLVDFFERDLPMVLHTLFGVAGALCMLALADPVLMLGCLLVVIPAGLVGCRHARRCAAANTRLHDELEREVGVIDRGMDVEGHYRELARWRIRLSDLEAIHVGLMEGIGIGLVGLALARTCLASDTDAGRVATVLGYLGVFIQALLNLPLLLEQQGRLRDIARRLGDEPMGEVGSGGVIGR